MARLLHILVLVPLGFICACLAAAGTLTVAIYRLGEDVYALDAVALVFTLGAAAAAGAFAAVPAGIAIVVAEVFAWRSLAGWLLFGGALGGIAQLLAERAGSPFAAGSPLRFIAAGVIGAFAYWLIAGRTAGGPSRTATPAAAPRSEIVAKRASPD